MSTIDDGKTYDLSDVLAIDKKVSAKLENVAATLAVLDQQIQEVTGMEFEIIDVLVHEVYHLAAVLTGDDELTDSDEPG